MAFLACLAFAAPPEFEVASVKANNTDERMDYSGGGSRISGKNIPAKRVDSDCLRRYGQLLLMLQTLLADRFRLPMHREMKESPFYAHVCVGHEIW